MMIEQGVSLDLIADLKRSLYACRRAMRSTLGSLTDIARQDVHHYLANELCDQDAADEWWEAIHHVPGD